MRAGDAASRAWDIKKVGRGASVKEKEKKKTD
jgi:hypothetical protein